MLQAFAYPGYRFLETSAKEEGKGDHFFSLKFMHVPPEVDTCPGDVDFYSIERAKAYAVPGVPEAESDEEALAAVQHFAEFLSRNKPRNEER